MPSKEAEELATEIGAAHIETSAKENINVGKCFVLAPHHSIPPVRTLGHVLTRSRLPSAKVFELCLAEIEKRQPNNKPAAAKDNGSTCTVM